MLAIVLVVIALIVVIADAQQPGYINLVVTPGTLPGLRSVVFNKADSVRNVTASASASGITVQWIPALLSNPVVTSYVITGGPGSCPVVIDAPMAGASLISLTMPVISGQSTVTVTVAAINGKF
jgi:hypothetical protein